MKETFFKLSLRALIFFITFAILVIPIMYLIGGYRTHFDTPIVNMSNVVFSVREEESIDLLAENLGTVKIGDSLFTKVNLKKDSLYFSTLREYQCTQEEYEHIFSSANYIRTNIYYLYAKYKTSAPYRTQTYLVSEVHLSSLGEEPFDLNNEDVKRAAVEKLQKQIEDDMQNDSIDTIFHCLIYFVAAISSATISSMITGLVDRNISQQPKTNN